MAENMVENVAENKAENSFLSLDTSIAIYLCGIMVVLAIIIVIGLLRQKASENKE